MDSTEILERISIEEGHVFVDLDRVAMIRASFILTTIPGITFSVSPAADDPALCALAVPRDQVEHLVNAIQWAESEVSQPATTDELVCDEIIGKTTNGPEVALTTDDDRLIALFGPGDKSLKDASLIGTIWNAWNGHCH